MFKRNIVPILSALALMTLFLLPAVVNAQKGPQGTTGAPLKSVDVKLGKNPAGSPYARTTTGPNGNFNFSDVLAGEYILTVSLPEGANNTANTRMRGGMNNPQSAAGRVDNPATVNFCYITLNLPGGKKVEKGYDLKKNKAFDPAIDPTTSKTITLQDFIVVFDGPTDVTGTIIIRNPNGKTK